MAGIYSIVGPEGPQRIDEAARRVSYFEDEEVAVLKDSRFSCAWVSTNDRQWWGPAFDPESGVRVITSGRVAFSAGDWEEGRSLDSYQGGVACRILLRRYLNHGAEGLLRHDGPAAVLVWDPRSSVVHLFTDHFGFQPVFLCRPDQIPGCVITTSPDALNGDSALSVSEDETSMVEFLSAWRATPPHSYYRDVKYAGAARHWTWDLRSGVASSREYWRPFEEDLFDSVETATQELESSIQQAIEKRTRPEVGPIVSFTGGGLDSRAILFAATDRSRLIALNLFDVPNREARIAQQLCRETGVRYVGFARDTDYYPRMMSATTRISNGMWSFEDQHYLGVRRIVSALGAKTVMSACSADWLFKSYGLEKTRRRLLGRDLPLAKLTPIPFMGFLPNQPRPVPPDYRAQVQHRLTEWFGEIPKRLVSAHDWLRMEDRRARPVCYAVSVSGGSMFRMFPYDTFLGDRIMADCYSRMPPQWKLNAVVWARAMRRLGGKAGRIVDANYGWAPGTNTAGKLLRFGTGWLRRRLTPSAKRLSHLGPATDGSWPDLAWYVANSPSLRDYWNSVPKDRRQRIATYTGQDPWHTPLSDWAARPSDLFRILTLLNWWDERSRNGPVAF